MPDSFFLKLNKEKGRIHGPRALFWPKRKVVDLEWQNAHYFSLGPKRIMTDLGHNSELDPGLAAHLQLKNKSHKYFGKSNGIYTPLAY